MNLENSIKDVITKKLEDGVVEKLISEQLEKGVLNALDNMFRSYGDVTKVIEEKIKSVMIPYLESYNYSEYIVKLDSVLVDVLKSSALENKKILENFKSLMSIEEKKVITVSELFDTWKEYVAEHIDTSGLKVNYDDDVSYEYVDINLEVEYESERSWSSFEYATLTFECEKDENLNFKIRLSRYDSNKNKAWDMSYDTKHDISSLKYLNEFEILLMRLSQAGTKLNVDTDSESDEVEPNAKPEPSYE